MTGRRFNKGRDCWSIQGMLCQAEKPSSVTPGRAHGTDSAGGYFIPVVAIPVVMKRCKSAKTSVIGSNVITVIAST